MITGFQTQDTIKPTVTIRINTDKLIPDSVFRKLDIVPAHIRYQDSIRNIKRTARVPEVTITDTTSVCARNSIADVTFYDSTSFVRNIDKLPPGFFPAGYAERSLPVNQELGTAKAGNLKDGFLIPPKPLDHDWIIAVVFLAAYLWLIVRNTSRSIVPEMTRFFLFRGINESSSRDTGSLFTWQSTVLNFVSFMVIGLFAYCAAEWYDLIPAGIPPLVFMVISLAAVILGVTSRHFICLAAGNLSDEREVFNEYMVSVYNSYRFSAVIIFGVVILLVYTVILPPEVFITVGAIVLIIFYLIRVVRLFLIFMKRNFSVLYLILYLCALEILPVLIIVKYFTGLDK
jgi:Domain of unknown function (DUF4271)